ncbi:sigma 54-interacting transcriptional regulator [Paraburkholderia sp. EG286B]|uniref:sigma 54-interacting transcriptional regulator n=1 Tax=Paraburkholderia sp. EG286B TaxID=3237011 RepID=UPI0034D25191
MTASPLDSQPRRSSPELKSLDAMDFSDILENLHFNPVEGRIWLRDRRMLLLATESLGVLRRELIEVVGQQAARHLLTRMGYVAGSRDAELAWRMRSHLSQRDIISAGVQLHALEGYVKTEPVHVEVDSTGGYCYSEFFWSDSVEDEIHLANYGQDHEPACWMSVGYTSGFLSKIMGKRILAREVECRAMGQSKCRIIAQPAENWDNAEEDLHYLSAEPNRATRKSVAPQSGAESTSKASDDSSTREPDRLVGSSVSFTSALHKVHRVASTQATVLLLGESGVGKSAVARETHHWSKRANAPFVEVNCAAIPESLLESELFGVERGAYSGAAESRPGRFESANGGTLFLDEIGILSFSAQGKLLRVLQSGEFERLGSNKTIKLDVRVVAATNENLPQAVKEGRFREDLFYRINVFPIRIPPLRDRRDDLPLLLEHFIKRLSTLHGRHIPGITPRALQAVLNYQWPGNIREFENVIERGIIVANDGESLDLRHLFSVDTSLGNASLMRLTELGHLARQQILNTGDESLCAGPSEAVSPPTDLNQWARSAIQQQTARLTEVETALIEAAMAETGGNVAKAATLLGLTRAQLDYRLKYRGRAQA